VKEESKRGEAPLPKYFPLPFQGRGIKGEGWREIILKLIAIRVRPMRKDQVLAYGRAWNMRWRR